MIRAAGRCESLTPAHVRVATAGRCWLVSRVRMGRKSAMAFPHRLHPDQQPSAAQAGPVCQPVSNRPAASTPRCHLQSGAPIEGEHQLEKLEFALAVALTRGDQQRSRQLRDQIEALGGNREEPGT